MYRCEASAAAAFVHQLAVSYIARGYWFYVTGQIPEGKDPMKVDQKLIDRYGIDISKWARARRKEKGMANMQYLRYGRFFVLLATHGEHRFFEEEASLVRDARRVPIKFQGYSISHRGGHAHVRIEQEEYKRMKSYFQGRASHRSAETLEAELSRLPFEPYAPIRRQLLAILRAVNRARKAAGYKPVSKECLRFMRRLSPVFAPAESERAFGHSRVQVD